MFSRKLRFSHTLALVALVAVGFVLKPNPSSASQGEPAGVEEVPYPPGVETYDDLLDRLQAASLAGGATYSGFLQLYFGGVDPFSSIAAKSKGNLESALRSEKEDPSPAEASSSSSALYSTRVSGHSNNEVETTMTTVRIGNLDHSMIAYQRKTAPGSLNWTAHVNATKTGDGFWTSRQMPMLSGYSRALDSVLASNVNSTGSFPLRSYFLTLQDYGPSLTPNQALSMVVSDSGGVGANPWFNPQTGSFTTAKKIVENTNATYYLDKPDMVVSNYSGTRGHIYVAYQLLQINPQQPYNTRLYVTKSSNGGASWTTPVLVHTGRIWAPQISHSVSFNRVYLSWVDFDEDRIEFQWSDNNGVTWLPTGQPEVAALTPLKTNENRDLDLTTSGATIPQMRFDSVNNQVILTWHESEYEVRGTHTGSNNSFNTLVDSTKNFVTLGVKPGDYIRNLSAHSDGFPNDSYGVVISVQSPTTILWSFVENWRPTQQTEPDFDNGDAYVIKAKATDVVFARKTATGWQPKVKIAVTKTRDQFQPSIDFSDLANKLMIGYLDNSANASLYEARWAVTNAAGTVTSQGAVADSYPTNPTEPGSSDTFIGDYTDTWFWPYLISGPDPWGPRFHVVFPTKHPTASVGTDIYASAVN